MKYHIITSNPEVFFIEPASDPANSPFELTPEAWEEVKTVFRDFTWWQQFLRTEAGRNTRAVEIASKLVLIEALQKDIIELEAEITKLNQFDGEKK